MCKFNQNSIFIRNLFLAVLARRWVLLVVVVVVVVGLCLSWVGISTADFPWSGSFVVLVATTTTISSLGSPDVVDEVVLSPIRLILTRGGAFEFAADLIRRSLDSVLKRPSPVFVINSKYYMSKYFFTRKITFKK